MAIEVTDEMRQAVYEADCELKGHEFQIGELIHSVAVTNEERELIGNPFKKVLGSPDEDKLPSISCARCNKVWMVVEDPGVGYDDAEIKLKNRLKATDSLAKSIKTRADRRVAKRQKEADEAAAQAATDAAESQVATKDGASQ